jgi:hypothetical protein
MNPKAPQMIGYATALNSPLPRSGLVQRIKWALAHLMVEICLSGSMSGMWKRSYGSSIEAPPTERGGNS